LVACIVRKVRQVILTFINSVSSNPISQRSPFQYSEHLSVIIHYQPRNLITPIKMQTRTFIISILASAFVCANPMDLEAVGGPQVCKMNMNGSGDSDRQTTKDCCAAVGGSGAYFNEVYAVCWPKSGPTGNSVNTGAMVQCCTRRRRGSQACHGTINC
jgi:hypothetical protein